MFKRELLPIFLIVLVDILGLTIVLPLLPFYAEKYGASPFVVGSIFMVFSFCQLVSGPYLGDLSDRWGRKRVLLLSQLGTFIGFLILGFAETLWLIFLARIIDGVTAGNITVAQAAISDVTEPHERAKSFALIGISFGLGFLVGPAISGYLAKYGYHYPVFAAAGLSLLSILATQFLLPAYRPSVPAERVAERKLRIGDWSHYFKYFARPRLGELLLQFFCFAFSFGLFLSGFALFAERRFSFGPEQVGYTYAYAGFLGLIVQGGMLGRLVKAFGEWKLSVAAFLLSFLGYLFLGLSDSYLGLMLACTVFSFGHSCIRPALTSLISQQADKTEQGVVLGLTQSLNSVATIMTPLIGGILIQYSYLTAWAMLAAGSSLLGGFLAFRTKPS